MLLFTPTPLGELPDENSRAIDSLIKKLWEIETAWAVGPRNDPPTRIKEICLDLRRRIRGGHDKTTGCPDLDKWLNNHFFRNQEHAPPLAFVETALKTQTG